jgi:hypothetical protein
MAAAVAAAGAASAELVIGWCIFGLLLLVGEALGVFPVFVLVGEGRGRPAASLSGSWRPPSPRPALSWMVGAPVR